MTKTIIFPDDLDFTDDRFDQMKNSFLKYLKDDFSNRFKRASLKEKLIQHEYNDWKEKNDEHLEMYGKILLQSYSEHYGLGSKSIREIIEEFAPYIMESAAEWRQRYMDAIEGRETEFSFMGNEASRIHEALMATWLRENPNFEDDPASCHTCFFDLRRKDGMYYFEKLAEYQAGLEYYDLICDLKDSVEAGHSELQTELDVIFYRPQDRIVWTGRGSKSHKLDFIKLVISLHFGGMINDGKGSFWAIIRQLAPVFGVQLGNNPRSSLSDHLKYENEGHDPLKFFDDLKAAFERYQRYSRSSSSD